MRYKTVVLSIIIAAFITALAGCSQNTESPLSDDTGLAITNDAKGEAYGAEIDACDGEAYDYAAPATATAAYDDGAPGTTVSAATHDPSSQVSEPEKQPPQAGQLTAGVWNDNENWGFFSNLVNTDLISFPSYGIDPRFRTVVNVKDKDGQPIANALVTLNDNSSNIIWRSVTDKSGIAYLFSPEGTAAVSAEIEYNGKKQTCEIQNAKTDTQANNKSSDSVNDVTLDAKSDPFKNTDIMFIVDATGSMSDEMVFLQSEFTAITNELGTENTRYAVNFYRDEGDDYVTKCNDFTSDIEKLQNALNAEEANGGGDTPEAVADILKESINNANWGEKSVKLAFLIFDAPPHTGTEEVISAAIKDASSKGIHIIPVVSSNSDRDTELFGRALAIATNGNYVFLTDDSGIGDSHLEPIIGYYEVQSLYDIIIDIVKEYKQ